MHRIFGLGGTRKSRESAAWIGISLGLIILGANGSGAWAAGKGGYGNLHPAPAIPKASSSESSTGVQWSQLSLDEALKQAAEKNQMIMLDFWSTHCGACGTQDIDVWQTEEGAKLTEGLIALKIESGSPEGIAASEKYPVTGLPEIIFLRPDGSEIDRVEGYFDRGAFLRQAQGLKLGLDPLPAMEVRLQARPDSLPLALDVLERYLNHRRDAEGESLYVRILRRDPTNSSSIPERAILRMARQAEYVAHDYDRTMQYWKTMIDRYPNATSVGGAVAGVYKCYVTQGRASDWVDWMCAVLKKNPKQAMLNRSAALTALNNGFRSHCFAEAARVASALGYPNQKAFMDSISVVLEGTPKAKR